MSHGGKQETRIDKRLCKVHRQRWIDCYTEGNGIYAKESDNIITGLSLSAIRKSGDATLFYSGNWYGSTARGGLMSAW